MSRLTAFLRRHFLLAGLAVSLVPLTVLLALQFVWLNRLERVSKYAYKAALSHSLETIGSEVDLHFREIAARSLALPASVLAEGRLEEAAEAWRKKPVPGARRLFLVDFTRSVYGNYYFFDPADGKLKVAPATEEGLAIIVACTPWQISVARPGGEVDYAPQSDERDRENRILLKPLVDGDGHVIGIAGMILDEEYLKRTFLPPLVKKVVTGFFPDADTGDYSVAIRDAQDRLVAAFGSSGEGREMVRRKIPFVFTDWTLVLHSRSPYAGAWTRASLAFNMTLVLLLSGVLVVGIVFALRAAHRAVRLSEMKSDFVSNVSHELRTPLASIRVFAEFLRMGRAGSAEKAQQYGEFIEAESRRLSRLIDNILDFSRIESGRKTYQLVPAALEEIVASTLRSFESRARQDGIRIGFEGPREALPPIAADPDAIGQAVYNLLDNAVKYSNGQKEIDVRVFREDPWQVVSIRDRGIGIPRHEQKRIFERFHRVGTGLVHDVKGAGLGLSIVHHVVRAHGGEVMLDSEPGRGSIFSIRLPAAPGPSGVRAAASPGDPKDGAGREGPGPAGGAHGDRGAVPAGPEDGGIR